MQGAHRRSDRNSARSFFVLPLVLALLALAAFPVFAHAGGIPEYEVEKNETELPSTQTSVKPKSHGSQHHASQNNPAAEGSDAGTKKSSEPKSETSEEPESEKSAAVGGTHPNDGGNKPGGEGGKSNAQQSKPDSKISGAEKVASAGNGKPASSSSSSSPVVPILIAVAVLAAISIGVVLYRQRKDDPGSGSDRRVSSPNAS